MSSTSSEPNFGRPDQPPEPQYVQHLRAELALALERATLAEDILRPVAALIDMWTRYDADLAGEPVHYRFHPDCAAPTAEYCRANHKPDNIGGGRR